MTNDIFNYSILVILLFVNFFLVIPCLLGYKYRISYTPPSDNKKAIAVTGKKLLLTVKNAITKCTGAQPVCTNLVVNGPLVYCKSENRIVL